MTPPDSHDPSALLVAEQFKHTLDLLNAELRMLEHRIASLEKCQADHELRLRQVTDGVTSFKTFTGLASGGSSILSVIAFVKALFLGAP